MRIVGLILMVLALAFSSVHAQQYSIDWYKIAGAAARAPAVFIPSAVPSASTMPAER